MRQWIRAHSQAIDTCSARSPNLPVSSGSQIAAVALRPAQRRSQASAVRSLNRSPLRTAFSSAEEPANRTASSGENSGKRSMSTGLVKLISLSPRKMAVVGLWKRSASPSPSSSIRPIMALSLRKMWW